ncbi:MAG: type 2 isopentenyl-diphosphate Delta-isomerase [Candidatus Helarchaeota archaeon]
MENKELRNRKLDHLKIPIEKNVQHSYNLFKCVKLLHYSLPEYDLDEINLKIDFFGKTISSPICIAGMTGGTSISKEINRILASAAQQENIILGIGSQRAAIEDPSVSDSFKIVRQNAPDIPIIGNIGIGQIGDINFNEENFQDCIEMINADVMAIHFNALHEILQKKGNTSYKLFQSKFKQLRKVFKIPIIAKETGTGFNQDIAKKLETLGFDGFDVGGYGGTSFPAIESFRINSSYNEYTRNPAELFKDWGIPTPVSILYVRKVSDKPIIATGGVRSGIDIVKSIVLGADVGGLAYNFLISAWKDYKNNSISNTINEIRTLKNEIRLCLWLLNVKNIKEIKDNRSKMVLLGDLYQWADQIR